MTTSDNSNQLEIEFAERQHTLQLKDIPVHTVFKKQDSAAAYMKVKSVNFLNNSNLLSDVFARGDCLVVNLHKGTLFVMDGMTKVQKLRGKMKLERMPEND
jgi:hypothetical protein